MKAKNISSHNNLAARNILTRNLHSKVKKKKNLNASFFRFFH